MAEIPDIAKLRKSLDAIAARGAPELGSSDLARLAWEMFGLLGGAVADLDRLAARHHPSRRSMDELYLRLARADEQAEDGAVAEMAHQLLKLLESVSADLRSRRAGLSSACRSAAA